MVKRGETVSITRRGKPVARLVADEAVRKPIDIEKMQEAVAATPWQEEGAGDFLERIRVADLL